MGGNRVFVSDDSLPIHFDETLTDDERGSSTSRPQDDSDVAEVPLRLGFRSSLFSAFISENCRVFVVESLASSVICLALSVRLINYLRVPVYVSRKR